MTTATATQDEDLLIISEDAAESSHDIDFSFHFGDEVSPVTPEVNESVSLASETLAPVTEVQAETSASLGDFSFDVFSESTQTLGTSIQDETLTVVDIVSDRAPEITLTETSRLDTTSEPIESISMSIQEDMTAPTVSVISEIPQEKSQEVSGAESLNDILTATITKLTLRAETISGESSGKSTQIATIQAQIKALEEQVSAFEGEISLLSSESEKISKNIEALEEMKLDPVKEHNARRAVKK